MKKSLNLFIVLLLIFAIPLTMSACKSPQEKAAEKTSEALMENATGADVDIDGEDIKIKTEDASYAAGDNLEWPAEAMGDLPVPKAEISVVMKDNESTMCTVGLKNFKKKDAEKYFAELKQMGFEGGMVISDEDSLIITGKRDDGSSINFIYNPSPEEGTIAFDRGSN